MITVAYLIAFIYFYLYSFNLNSRSYCYSLIFNAVVCPDPGVPTNGKRLNNNFREGETVIFGCNRDYDLVGNDAIRCEGGMWSGEVPKCRGSSN